MKTDLTKVADSIRRAFASGKPCSAPLLSGGEFRALVCMLRERAQKAA